ncbi:hypothetical protein GCM10023238_05730 [Streptomyces heliomycini]
MAEEPAQPTRRVPAWSSPGCPAERWPCATPASPTAPALVYTRAEIEAMLLGVKDGEFDHLVVG